MCLCLIRLGEGLLPDMTWELNPTLPELVTLSTRHVFWVHVLILRVDPNLTSVSSLQALSTYYSLCDLQTSNISITWELVRNADFQAHRRPDSESTL